MNRTTRAKAVDTANHLKFRTRWRHILHIDQSIRSGCAPNCGALAGELEVSRRTVLRDIDFLRYDLGAPIEYSPKRRGYLYTEPNWSLPNLRISEGDLFAIMVAEQALQVYEGTPWHDRLKSAFDRIVACLPDRIEFQPQEIMLRFSFDPQGVSIVDPDILEGLSQAIRQNRTVEIQYVSLKRGVRGTHTIDPYALRFAHGSWYLAGRDHRSNRVPLFNLSRIDKLKATQREFDYQAAAFDHDGYFNATFGVFETAKPAKITIDLSGIAAQLVQERRWHSSQVVKKMKGGRVRFSVEVSHTYDILPWILSWGEEAKVVAPRKLKVIVAEKVKKMSRLYC